MRFGRAARLVAVVVVGLVLVGGGNPAGRGGSFIRPAPTLSVKPVSTPSSVRPETVNAVIGVEDLVDNRSVTGDHPPPIQTDPEYGTFDPANGDLYTRGDGGTALSVINGTTGRAIATIPLAGAEVPYPVIPTIAADPKYDTVFLTNFNGGNVTVLNATTQEVQRTIALPRGPAGIAVVPATGTVYVADYTDANVSVISGATDRVVKNITVGIHPEGFAYDGKDQRLYVSNLGSDNVTGIDVDTNKAVTTVKVGTEPLTIQYDPENDYVNVADFTGGALTIINAALGSVFRTIPLGTGWPYDLAWDPLTDDLYVANQISDNVTVINDLTGHPVANLPIPSGPESIVFDPHGAGFVYVSLPGSEEVMVLDGFNTTYLENLTVPTLPTSVLVDNVTGDAYSLGLGGAEVDPTATRIAPTRPPSLDGSIPLEENLESVLYDPARHALNVLDEYGNASHSLVGSGPLLGNGSTAVGGLPVAQVYDPTTRDLYIANVDSETVSTVTPTGAAGATYPIGPDPTGIAVDPGQGSLWVSTDYGNVTVISIATGHETSVLVGADDLLTAVLYDSAHDAVYVADGSRADVVEIDPTTDLVNATVHVGTDPDALLLDPTNNTIFVANDGSGNLSVINATANAVVQTIAAPGVTYLALDPTNDTVLAAGHYEPVLYDFNATNYTPAAPDLALGDITPGGIGYDVADHTVYVLDAFEGSLLEIGPPLPTATYTITFQEVGLPFDTLWSIELAERFTEGDRAPSPLAFSASPGTYPYSVLPVLGYHPTLADGNVSVSTVNVTITVDFLTDLTATLTPSAASIALGGSETLTTATVGGVGPFNYTYTLPSPCRSRNATTVVCTPGATGTDSVHVTVTDAQGVQYVANASFVVQPSGSPPHSTSSSPNFFQSDWYVLVAAGIAAALGVSALVIQRRRRDGSPPPPPEAPPTPPATPPP